MNHLFIVLDRLYIWIYEPNMVLLFLGNHIHHICIVKFEQFIVRISVDSFNESRLTAQQK